MTNEVAQVMQSHYWGTGSEWLWAFGQFVVVTATLILIVWQVFFIAKQVKLQTKQTEIETMSHVVQSVCTIQERWHSEAMQRVRFDVCNRWNKDRKKFDEFDGACEHIANFFEELGAFVKIGAIPKETMWDVQSWNIEYYWGMLKNGIEGNRKECEENVYSDFEKLFRDMREISDAKGAPSVDEKSIGKFVEREIRGTKACLDIKKGSSYY
jgi:hypothetical protein